jgi:molybdate transport system substrate-binding protein
MLKKILLAVFAASALIAAAGCAKQLSDDTLTIGAAASMRFVLEEAALAYRQETGREIALVFGSTGDLARQIEAGAPLDLFIAAGREHVEQLVRSGRLAAGTEKVFAVGRIVLATNKVSGLQLFSLDALLAAEVDRIAIANPNHAPYGRAAKEALQTTGIWEQIEPKIVYGETAGQVLQFIQSGNAQAGIIALALADVPEISYIIIDDSLHNPLEQMLGLVEGSPRTAEAAAFSQYLTGPAGSAILERYGFQVPD